MKITPALPNPLPPQPQARAAVGSVQAAKRPGDAADDAQRGPVVVRPVDPTGRESAVGLGEGLPAPATGGGTLRAHRALAIYQGVSAFQKRSDLRRLLGFDAYA